MARIDVDAHVDETDATWAFLAEADLAHRPATADPGVPTVPGDRRPHRIWLIDGHTRLRRWRDDVRTGTVRATRELADVPARLAHMDELNVDVQVLYPTLFLGGYTARAEVERALTGAYNRWMADATHAAGGRLRWVALAPMLDVAAAVGEVRWAKAHGACGILKKGIESGRTASDPYFFPLYEEASRLDMPICIHTGTGNPPSDGPDVGGRLNAVSAFTDLAMSDVPERFPDLRIGWIETGASWVPFLMADLAAKAQKLTFHPFDDRTDLFRRCPLLRRVRHHRRPPLHPQLRDRGQPHDRHGLHARRSVRRTARTRRDRAEGGRRRTPGRRGQEDRPGQSPPLLRHLTRCGRQPPPRPRTQGRRPRRSGGAHGLRTTPADAPHAGTRRTPCAGIRDPIPPDAALRADANGSDGPPSPRVGAMPSTPWARAAGPR